MFEHFKIAIATCLALGISALSAHAQFQWTSMGGNGTLDSGSASIASVRDILAHTYPNTGTVRMRYNLPLDTFLLLHSNTGLVVRYRDAGNSGDWIKVSLKEFDPVTGQTWTRMVFDSNSFPSSVNWQERSTNSSFDFNQAKVYYLEAELYRSTTAPAPPLLLNIRVWRY